MKRKENKAIYTENVFLVSVLCDQVLSLHKQDFASSLGRAGESEFVSRKAKRVWTYSSLASPIPTALKTFTLAFKSQQSLSFFCQKPGSHDPPL